MTNGDIHTIMSEELERAFNDLPVGRVLDRLKKMEAALQIIASAEQPGSFAHLVALAGLSEEKSA